MILNNPCNKKSNKYFQSTSQKILILLGLRQLVFASFIQDCHRWCLCALQEVGKAMHLNKRIAHPPGRLQSSSELAPTKRSVSF